MFLLAHVGGCVVYIAGMWKYVFIVLGCAFFVKHVFLPKGVMVAVWVYGGALVALVALLWWDAKRRRRKAVRGYVDAAYDAVLKHIENTFGVPERVFVQDDETVFMIPPTTERPFITLVTFGKWCHCMNVPEAYAGRYASYAEFLLTLPPDWSPEVAPWAVPLLLFVSRMPEREKSWFCPGHTLGFDSGSSIVPGTEQTAVLLLSPNHVAPDDATISLPDNEKLSFLQLVLLYPEELEFLHQQPLGSIPPEMEHMARVVDLHRPRISLPSSAVAP